MLTRAEKLFNIRAQVSKAVAEIEHGATLQGALALADALSGVLRFLDEEVPEKLAVPVVVGSGEGDHPRTAQVESFSGSIKRPLEEPEPVKSKGDKRK